MWIFVSVVERSNGGEKEERGLFVDDVWDLRRRGEGCFFPEGGDSWEVPRVI